MAAATCVQPSPPARTFPSPLAFRHLGPCQSFLRYIIEMERALNYAADSVFCWGVFKLLVCTPRLVLLLWSRETG